MAKRRKDKMPKSAEEKKAASLGLVNNLSFYISIGLIVVLIVLIFVTQNGDSFLSEDSLAKLKNVLIGTILGLLVIIFTFILSLGLEKKLFGVQIIKFRDIDETMRYIIKKVKKANKVIRDLTWLDAYFKSPSKEENNEQRKALEEQLFNAIIDRSLAKKVCYRQVFTFKTLDDKRLKAMETTINLYIKKVKGVPSGCYYCSYYETGNMGKGRYAVPRTFPKLQFMVIDDEIVVFTSRRYNGNLCAITDKTLVNIFVDYCEQAEASDIEIYNEGFLQEKTVAIIEGIKEKLRKTK